MALPGDDETTGAGAPPPAPPPAPSEAKEKHTLRNGLIIAAAGVVLTAAGAALQPRIVAATSDPPAPTCSDPQQLTEIDPASITVAATSTHADEGTVTYDADNLLDGLPSTAWVEGRGAAGRTDRQALGVGEKVTFTFDGTRNNLRLACIMNGYGKSWDAYQQNSLMTRATVTLDGGTAAKNTALDFRTEKTYRRYSSLALPGHTARTVTITIADAQPGAKDTTFDLAISEVKFFAG